MKNRKTGLSIWLAVCVLCLLAVLPAMGCAETEGNGSGAILESILARGVLRVGTAGDYMPMSYLDPETGNYVGFDAELAEDLAAALGVKVQYIETSWPTLMEDTLAGKFDLAVCGITITEARKEQALMSEGYLGTGKTVIARGLARGLGIADHSSGEPGNSGAGGRGRGGRDDHGDHGGRILRGAGFQAGGAADL